MAQCNDKGLERLLKILLVTIPNVFRESEIIDMTYLESMGILYVAGALRAQGYDVDCWDSIILGGIPGLKGYMQLNDFKDGAIYLGLNPNYLQYKIRQFKPDIIGMSLQHTSDYNLALAIMSTIKAEFPKVIIVAGGPHVTQNIKECVDNKYIDYAIMGEGEIAFPMLVQEIENGNMTPDIPGVCYENKITDFELIQNVDDIGIPAWGLLPMRGEYLHWCNAEGRKISIYSSRGCPYDCNFCSSKTLNKRKWRAHSVDRVLFEIDLLVKDFRVGGILFRDDYLNVDIARMNKILEGVINNKYGIMLEAANLRADNLPRETLELMKKAGFVRANLFPESGSQRVLNDLMNKNLDLGKFHKAVEDALDVGLNVGLCLMIGYPGETMDEINQTFKMAHKLKEKGVKYFQISIATPIPGTKMYDTCLQNGYIDSMKVDTFGYHVTAFDTEHWKGEDLIKLMEKEVMELNR